MNKLRIAVAALSLFAVVGGANAAMVAHGGKTKPHAMTMMKAHPASMHCEKGKLCPTNKMGHAIKASAKK